MRMPDRDDEQRSRFEISHCDLMGRLGTLTVNGRKVTTPHLMPVVNPGKMETRNAITPKELLETFGFRMLITNSYIIGRNPRLRDRAISEGLHRMLAFDGIIMTDSGTFQSYMYGSGGSEVDVDPLEIVRFQKDIGSDIGTILDRFTEPDSDHQAAEQDLSVTLKRAAASLEAAGTGMEVAVPVQGGRHLDLRERSGSEVRRLGVGYAPIGGVVPVMGSYDYPLLVDIIASSKKGLGPSVPVHLFGAGHPMILPLAVAMGCDLFDSASYIKFARDGRYMTRDRTYHLKEMDVLPCSCPVCSTRDPGDILSLPGEERTNMVARHNLWVLQTYLNEIRASIKEGTLWELVERSASANPRLHSAVRRMREHSSLIEGQSPRSTRRFMCSSSLSLARPEFARFSRDVRPLLRGNGEDRTLVLTDWGRSRSRNVVEALEPPARGWSCIVRTPMGPVPYEIMEMYPAGQSIFSDPSGLDEGMLSYMDEEMSVVETGGCLEWNGIGRPDDTEYDLGNREEGYAFRKLRSMVRFQFPDQDGMTADRVLFGDYGSLSELGDRLELVYSRKTGKLRNVHLMEEGRKLHLLSLRAEDGLFTLKIEGARRFHSGFSPPWKRVVVDSETGEFNAMGYNVFCKFVLDADPSIRPLDEVLIVDQDDEFLACGKAVVGSDLMRGSRSGIAVKVREGTTPSKRDPEGIDEDKN